MVNAGMADETIVHAIRGADAVAFDLTPDGQKALTAGGVSVRVLTAMKAQAAKKPATKPAAHKGLNNTQIIAMVKSGIADGSVIEAINGAADIDFDLSAGRPAAAYEQRRQRTGSGGNEGPRGEEARGDNPQAGGAEMIRTTRSGILMLAAVARRMVRRGARFRRRRPLRGGTGSRRPGAREDQSAERERRLRRRAGIAEARCFGLPGAGRRVVLPQPGREAVGPRFACQLRPGQGEVQRLRGAGPEPEPPGAFHAGIAGLRDNRRHDARTERADPARPGPAEVGARGRHREVHRQPDSRA